MTLPFRLDDIQGNIIPGFAMDHQALILIRFSDTQAARTWLAALLQLNVSSGTEVAAARRPGVDTKPPLARPHCLNVAFTWLGLKCLGAPEIDAFPEEFREGMFQRARFLGDGPAARIARWEGGGTRAKEAHALLIVAGDTSRGLALAVRQHLGGLAEYGHQALRTYYGNKLPGKLYGHEHFGFRDGISQPRLDSSGPRGPDSAPGEFILGYPNAQGDETFGEPSWARDGSYLVFRKLRQHVGAFRRAVTRLAPRVSLGPEQLAALLVGRWPSGAKLGDPLEQCDPGWPGRSAAVIIPGEFAYDPGGERVPLFAHIRKAHPRDLDSDEPWRHRLIRRGIPYGPPLPEHAAQDDGQDRGLLFLAYQANLARQFEHVQRRWLNNPNFPVRGNGPDPLVGHVAGPRQVSLPVGEGRAPLNLAQFVSVAGGGYFFAPSIPALAYLASLRVEANREGNVARKKRRAWVASRGQSVKPAIAAAYAKLGEFIMEENPYGYAGKIRDDFKTNPDVAYDGLAKGNNVKNPFRIPIGGLKTPQQLKALWWYFNGTPCRVTKAIRIPYTYPDPTTGESRTEHLLLGYEGGSGNGA